MKSVWTLVTAGLATLAIFSCAVPPAPPPPPVVAIPTSAETVAPPPSSAPGEGATERRARLVESLASIDQIMSPAPAADPPAKVLNVRDRGRAMELLREEERRHPELSFKLVEFGAMTRVGPHYRLIAKKKESSASAKAD